MIKTVIELLMIYFNDDTPVSSSTLQRKCEECVISEAVAQNYIKKHLTSDGYVTYTITQKGKILRNK